MADLSHDAVHKFWHEYEDPMIYRVISFMEGVEDWTLDGNPELELAITALSEELSKVGNYELGSPEEFIQLAGNIRTGRGLRLLQAMDTAHPGAASKLLIHAEETSESNDDPPGLFLRRNITFERLRLLSRIFASERVSLILSALEGE
ncbi:MAG: phosphoesterase [Legionellales bacterium]|nr:phosphoesterase [Legionellales bacterium]|tara:strand:- start:1314 stop:1757 length:444 start_codon:yes stop_codon:yes gene_type:complete